jgi:NADPH:quinone reductase-like Zn-dependent oxidoreductase
MRAFIIDAFGEPGGVGERAKPEPGIGEILVRVKAAGVNAMDPIIRSGYAKDMMEHRLPLTPGLDYAGTVEAVGSGVAGFGVGDEVFGSVGKLYFGEGSFAEYVTATAALAAKRPSSLAVQTAAALPTAAGAALAAVDALDVQPGATIAIVGAAGGVGAFATQIAVRRGFRVVALTGASSIEVVRGFGATDVLDYGAGDIVGQLKAIAPGGLDGIVDLYHDVQGAVPLAAAIKPGGRFVSPIAFGIDQALAGGPVSGHNVRAATDRIAEIGELAVGGSLVVAVEALPLDRAAEALDRQASRQVRGKLVLVIG